MSTRIHLVMVPGFGGFDALGSIRYYAGVTKIFDEWKKDRKNVALHYFDNLPTASVAARAQVLREYLAKRVARGEFQKDDELVLIGHSTGGLDIRQLIRDLDAGILTQSDDVEIDPMVIGEKIKRVVFLSVPQMGSNIADFVEQFEDWRRDLGLFFLKVSFIREGVEAIAKFLINKEPADLFRALDDVEAEIEKQKIKSDDNASDAERAKKEVEASNARHSQADVALWFENTHHDFLAIKDLAVKSSRSNRLVDEARAKDASSSLSKKLSIRTRSYATVVKSPFPADFTKSGPTPSHNALRIVSHARHYIAGTDAIFRGAYAACSAGPFTASSAADSAPATWFVPPPTTEGESEVRAPPDIRDFDNDGIVNTASMFWPDGKDTRLVYADHGDIIGHYTIDEAEKKNPKKNRYDLLGSSSGFSRAKLEKVWCDVFAFAVSNE